MCSDGRMRALALRTRRCLSRTLGPPPTPWYGSRGLSSIGWQAGDDSRSGRIQRSRGSGYSGEEGSVSRHCVSNSIARLVIVEEEPLYLVCSTTATAVSSVRSTASCSPPVSSPASSSELRPTILHPCDSLSVTTASSCYCSAIVGSPAVRQEPRWRAEALKQGELTFRISDRRLKRIPAKCGRARFPSAVTFSTPEPLDIGRPPARMAAD